LARAIVAGNADSFLVDLGAGNMAWFQHVKGHASQSNTNLDSPSPNNKRRNRSSPASAQGSEPVACYAFVRQTTPTSRGMLRREGVPFVRIGMQLGRAFDQGLDDADALNSKQSMDSSNSTPQETKEEAEESSDSESEEMKADLEAMRKLGIG